MVTTIHHPMIAILHHHPLLTILMRTETMVFKFANTTGNKANEQYESNYDKEPCDKGEKFTGYLFFEFCQQQGACKN